MHMVNVFTTESFPAEYRVFECIFTRQSGKRLPLRKTGLTPYLCAFWHPILCHVDALRDKSRQPPSPLRENPYAP
jgi:hypothetical protein